MKSNKTIMLVGGGSGGHLTPIVAVAESLKDKDNNTQVIHVGQKGEGLDDVTDIPSIDKSFNITAGKFRRYHGESFLSHLLDIKTLLLNIRDFFRFIIGTIQAWILLGKTKPDSIFLKGGFVSVPVGYAARLRSIPYITHDSDVVPGLANKLTAKHALYNTTAMPAEIYNYDQSKTIQVGIPIRKEFQKVSKAAKESFREELGIDTNKKVILSVGGGLGAQRVNYALVEASKKVFEENEDAFLIHLTGKKLYDETARLYRDSLSESDLKKVMLIDFTNELYKYSASADIVITRAGATNIAEFAAQAMPCIVIPASHLTGGQQLHNADVLKDSDAAVVINEEDLESLSSVINKIILSKDKEVLSENINKLAVYDSSDKISQILNDIIK